MLALEDISCILEFQGHLFLNSTGGFLGVFKHIGLGFLYLFIFLFLLIVWLGGDPSFHLWSPLVRNLSALGFHEPTSNFSINFQCSSSLKVHLVECLLEEKFAFFCGENPISHEKVGRIFQSLWLHLFVAKLCYLLKRESIFPLLWVISSRYLSSCLFYLLILT